MTESFAPFSFAHRTEIVENYARISLDPASLQKSIHQAAPPLLLLQIKAQTGIFPANFDGLRGFGDVRRSHDYKFVI